MLDVTLIGFGAIGQAICRRLGGSAQVRVTHVVVRAPGVAAVQLVLDGLGGGAQAVADVPPDALLAVECAGHEALKTHVLSALARGTECAVLSVGALAEPGLPELLADAATRGGTQVHLLSGAIGGIDAIAAARLAGLEEVTYTGRKPPSAWAPVATVQAGQVAQTSPTGDSGPNWKGNRPSALVHQAQIAIILEASAREAARLYPKNANVAATVALAGLGLDATRVRLISDPAVTENIHEIHAKGAFGELRIELRGKPLADNPKTSALTVLSALRFLHNHASAMTI
jgi:aspartate dehydrogenase